jgi:predicted nucleic acid-binding Zn ribbon protein
MNEKTKLVLEKINSQPWYFKEGKCDDCLFHGDNTKKLVKRIEDDGLCFCEKHWANHRKVMLEGGVNVEPFYQQ